MNITSKGQVTIPLRIRNRFGLKPGTAVEFIANGDLVVLKPQKRRAKDSAEQWLSEATGYLHGKSTTELMKITRGED